MMMQMWGMRDKSEIDLLYCMCFRHLSSAIRERDTYMSGASLKTFPANTGVRCMLNEVMKGGEVILKKCRGKSWSFSEKA